MKSGYVAPTIGTFVYKMKMATGNSSNEGSFRGVLGTREFSSPGENKEIPL